MWKKVFRARAATPQCTNSLLQVKVRHLQVYQKQKYSYRNIGNGYPDGALL